MRVIFVCGLPPFDLDAQTRDLALGGIEACNVGLARALARRGHDVEIASEEWGATRRDAFGVAFRNLREARAGRGDALVVSNVARRFERFAGSGAAPIYWMHNPLRFEKALRKGDLLPLLRLRPMAVFPSLYLQQRARLYPFRAREVIGHGLDEAFLDAAPARHAPEEPARFVFSSQPHRGLDRVLRIWRDQTAPAAPQAELHLFGAAPQALEDAALRIRVHGRLSKSAMIERYAGARAMLYPGAEDETYCLAAAEAQSVGLPVVTMGIGALSERVDHGVDGFICRDDADFARKTLLLAARPDIAATMRESARAGAPHRTWDVAARLWEELVFARLA